MIGLVCLDHILCERGWTVANLGADVPPTDLASFISRNEATLVALSASHPARIEDVTAAVDAVRAASPNRLPMMLGGRLAAQPALAAQLDVDWVGGSLESAARFADSVLGGLPAASA
jgi:methanogenic corrinoid protein MtbC1